MATIAFALVSLLGVALLTVVYLGLSNPTMFKFGLRNIPRRGLQSVLVIAGLALGTLITTAAFVTGDTVDHSLTKDAYALFGRQDLDISWNGEPEYFSDTGVAMGGEQVFVNGAVVDALEAAFASDEEIVAFQPMLRIAAPVTNLRTGDAKPAIQLSGVDAERLDRVGGLTLTSGESVSVSELRGGNVYLSERAARNLRAMAGDGLTVHLGDGVVHVRVAGVVRDELASGVLGMSFSSVAGGMVLPIETLREMAGLTDREISALTVSLRGGVRTTLDTADAAAGRIRAYREGEGAGLLTPTGGLPAGQPGEVLAMEDGRVRFWEFAVPHPETTVRTLFRKVWYEGYPEPTYTWQSSAMSEDYEPKFSLIPLIFGVLVIVPPQMYFAQRFHSAYQGSFFDYYPRFFDAPYPTGDYPGLGFSFAHLWFIFDLFIISIVVLPLFLYFKSASGRRLLSAINGVLCHRLALFLLLVPLIFITLVPDLMGHPILFYLLYFVYGFVLVSDQRMQTAVAKSRTVGLILAIIATLGYFALALIWEAQNATNTLPWLAFWMCYYGAGWFWSIVFLGYVRLYLSKGNRVLTYANQAAYPYYVLHQTVIVVLGFYIVQWDMPVALKYLGLVVGALVVTLGLYDVLVRRILPIRVLMGVKVKSSQAQATPGSGNPTSA
jgi:hypothetical protein